MIRPHITMSGNVCLRCGLPATRSYALYDWKKSTLIDVPICESCFASYTPALKKDDREPLDGRDRTRRIPLAPDGPYPAEPGGGGAPAQGLGKPSYLLAPPLLLALLKVPTPTTAPEGWLHHAWLGASYAFPMSALHHVFLLNAYLALANSMPIRPLDGGYIVPALVRSRTGYYLSILLALILLTFATIPMLLQHL